MADDNWFHSQGVTAKKAQFLVFSLWASLRVRVSILSSPDRYVQVGQVLWFQDCLLYMSIWNILGALACTSHNWTVRLSYEFSCHWWHHCFICDSKLSLHALWPYPGKPYNGRSKPDDGKLMVLAPGTFMGYVFPSMQTMAWLTKQKRPLWIQQKASQTSNVFLVCIDQDGALRMLCSTTAPAKSSTVLT